MKPVKLQNKYVGDGYPCYIVAEIGGAFMNFEEAKRLIDSAIELNIDAIKFQTLEADTITTKNNYFDFETTGHVSQYEIFKHFELSKDLQRQVVRYANDCGIPIFSAPSHQKDLEIMKELELPIYKIGSDLACHVPLLKEVAKLNKPIILSTGMCNMEEVAISVDAIKNEGNEQIIIMHCVSNYPSQMDELNLNTINSMKEKFDLPVGFSDHTIGIISTLASVVIGANMIERHFKDPLNSPGPDDIHSLIKKDFAEMIQNIRNVEKVKGDGKKAPTPSEMKNLTSNRVSIIALKNIPVGTKITQDMIDIRRPGTGLQPVYFEKVLGMKAKINIQKDDPLKWEIVE